ncbi:MAG: rod shape-determining protein MreC [Deltaproteobacteria bacterium]|nr:rod shape-determining protein MreC [Deltaproteobacteria bacterium]MDH4122001.1 rod shape-determining protein MreC [Deltaproteobacteria bacterium]
MFDLFRQQQVLITGLVLALAMAGLLSLRVQRPGVEYLLQDGLGLVVSPAQQTYSSLTGQVQQVKDDYVNLVRLQEENVRLKNQVMAMEEQLNQYINDSVQFNLLREQLKFQEQTPQDKEYSEVIGESADNYHHVVVINKGAQYGFRHNYPVVLREGVVGRVQSVTPQTAVVQLIVDRRHALPVLIQRTRERMMVFGRENNLGLDSPEKGLAVGGGDGLDVERIRPQADIQPGDRVITSGMGGVFPKGLLVGTVLRVYQRKHELFLHAEVAPAVNFNRLEGVFVMKPPAHGPSAPLFTAP